MFDMPAFIPGYPHKSPKPLARYLPPIPYGVASSWLEAHIPPGAWVFDPFGAAPELAIEAARCGYRVLIAANNPVLSFILEMAADPPQAEDLQSALASLAFARKGRQRLEPHLKSLYDTTCANCNATIMAEAFLWEEKATRPYARIYSCPNCHDSGERPVTEADIARASQFTNDSLTRSRALERVVSISDPDRVHAEIALATYPPRAVYALITLINNLHGLQLPDAQKQHLEGLILTACDRANSLWPHPSGRARPRQLSVPRQYRENNIWLALEDSIEMWGSDSHPISVTHWPDDQLPPEVAPMGGISLFKGRAINLAESLERIQISAILTAFPRPNQAFWTLSALWAGWLWGRESVGLFKRVLRRRRYDWGWHATALHATLDKLTPFIPPSTPFFGLIGEAEPGFISAALIATYLAGFELKGVALRESRDQAQITWQQPSEPLEIRDSGKTIIDLIAAGAKDHLRQRGEPTTYLCLHTAGLEETVNVSASLPEGTIWESISQLQASFQPALSYQRGFLRFGGSDKSLEVGQWWLQQTDPDTLPLADRVEIAIVNQLQRKPGCTITGIDQALCAAFPGLLTPDPQLIEVCLESYGEQDPPDSNCWKLRDHDSPTTRRAEITEIEEHLKTLGERLKYEVKKTQDDPLSYQWTSIGGSPGYLFYLSASAVLGKYLTTAVPKSLIPVIILPGSRANIVAYKLKNNPQIQYTIDQGWHFLKYRHLRSLVDHLTLTPINMESQFDLDPLTYTEPQLRML